MSRLYRKPSRTGLTEAWSLGNPRNEAEQLMVLIKTGEDTASSVRELIRVPEKVQREWESIPDRVMRNQLKKMLKYRAKVLAEFERLYAASQHFERFIPASVA